MIRLSMVVRLISYQSLNLYSSVSLPYPVWFVPILRSAMFASKPGGVAILEIMSTRNSSNPKKFSECAHGCFIVDISKTLTVQYTAIFH